jgi:thymidylate kinase
MSIGIVIVDGPDGVGKTTLINHIKKNNPNSYYMHLRVHKDMKLWHTATARLAQKKRKEGKLVLLDRHWPSEQCYSYIYRSGPAYNPKLIYEQLKNNGTLYVWCIPEDTERVKENHRINRERRHEEYPDIDDVVDYYYQHWFSKPKRSNFLSDLSPLRERINFIRYDLFKDGHKLDEFTNKIMERLMVLQI